MKEHFIAEKYKLFSEKNIFSLYICQFFLVLYGIVWYRMLLRGIVINGWIFPGAIVIWLKNIWKMELLMASQKPTSSDCFQFWRVVDIGLNLKSISARFDLSIISNISKPIQDIF